MTIIYKKVLVGIDESFHVNNFIERIVELQKSWNSKIVIFYSNKHRNIPMDLFPVTYISSDLYQRVEEEIKREGEELLKKKEELFKNAGISFEARLIEDEVPEIYIKRIVEEENFDLVVLRSGTNMIKEAPCDVLIVK